ncbi:MAG: lysozyme inhibitor LprI family protein [Burkholderiaceae bacterium]|nr:lysozyme inhibitor LprI family protein [Burkholderiaceae bacterium]
MRTLALVIFFVFATPASFAAKDESCTNRPECWPEGSSMHTGLLAAQQQLKTEATLSRLHANLVELVASARMEGSDLEVNSRLINALKKQQLVWLKYRTEECEVIGSLTGAGGTWQSTYATRCDLALTEQRLKRVKSAIRCINRMPLESRYFEQGSCLQQLAQLVNK